MEYRPLTPAAREDLVQSLAYALRYNRQGKRVSDRDIVMANAAAEHLVESMKRSGFVVMKGPPGRDSAPTPVVQASYQDRTG